MNDDHKPTAVSKESGSTEWNGDGSKLTDFTNDFAILEISHFTRHKLISRIPIYVSLFSLLTGLHKQFNDGKSD